jgi:hypothetical protein
MLLWLKLATLHLLIVYFDGFTQVFSLSGTISERGKLVRAGAAAGIVFAFHGGFADASAGESVTGPSIFQASDRQIKSVHGRRSKR